MNDFKVTCNNCGNDAQYSLAADFDIKKNAVVAQFALFCKECKKQEGVFATIDNRNLIPCNADQEVKDAIAEYINGDG